jgi:ribonuclease VapC
MFVDASAIVAILTDEPEADEFMSILGGASGSITSPIAIYEATLGFSRKRGATMNEASGLVSGLISQSRIACVPIDAAAAETALLAHEKFGKGRGHPARLNMGDCFAYAVAKNRGVPLLYKGDDFAKTDVKRATRAKK